MCFSAEASFTVSALLLITGVASIKKATASSQFVFSGIPIVFSIQQFAEGILWLALKNPEYSEWQEPAAYAFLICAQGLWPVWVPLAFLLLEENIKRKKILGMLLLAGAALSGYLAYCLFNYPIRFGISGHHIHYDLLFPNYLGGLSSVLYFMAIVFSPFISSVSKTWILGVLNLMAFFISLIFFHDNIISVWCFFAALLSAVVLVIVLSLNRKKEG